VLAKTYIVLVQAFGNYSSNNPVHAGAAVSRTIIWRRCDCQAGSMLTKSSDLVNYVLTYLLAD